MIEPAAVSIQSERGGTMAGAVCASCGSPTVATFCADCGERQPSAADYSVSSVTHELLHDFVHFDGKIWRTIVALLTKPGLLTREYFAGRRSHYTKPLSLFLVVNLAFFVLQPHTGLLQYHLDGYVNPTYDIGGSRAAMADARRTELKLSPQDFSYRFENTIQEQKKSFLIVCVPIFAAALFALYFGRRHYVEHLVFAVHSYSYYLIFLGFLLVAVVSLIMLGLQALGLGGSILARFMETETAVDVALLLGVGGY
ncbi:MAG TPA: DUF3667 domain-containing protein, partial [Gemmatimonadaceae bacterium]